MGLGYSVCANPFGAYYRTVDDTSAERDMELPAVWREHRLGGIRFVDFSFTRRSLWPMLLFSAWLPRDFNLPVRDFCWRMWPDHSQVH